MKRLSYHLLYGIAYSLSLLPLCVHYVLSDCIFLIVFYIVRYRRKLVQNNLSDSFPEKSQLERSQLERQFYHWLCDYVAETVKLLSISNESLLKHIEFRGVEELEKVFDEGRNCAAILGHYCNWEWLSATGLAFQRHPSAVMGLIYHPLYNEAFNQLFIDIRSSHGGQCVPKQDILRSLISLKRENRRSLFGYISDQSPKWENMHLWVDFLNHDTPVFTGAERIMQKMNDAVFYVDMQRPRRGKYICTFRLITNEAAKEEEFAITRRFFELLEESIRRQPSFYLWTHNRWKRGREEFNRKYDVIDGKIIRKEEYK
ncbi:lysophospholipid acyltransferase family protein [Xylanibacter brevis]|uniref:lysophospholipid acyltransferase family protein n=1 Tax=Xylanibacter brevis TaxID=83231 RepID=UPI0005C62455|nr:lysophospholipid acyltransferase family protein [Xylanibacter brevis]